MLFLFGQQNTDQTIRENQREGSKLAAFEEDEEEEEAEMLIVG